MKEVALMNGSPMTVSFLDVLSKSGFIETHLSLQGIIFWYCLYPFDQIFNSVAVEMHVVYTHQIKFILMLLSLARHDININMMKYAYTTCQ